MNRKVNLRDMPKDELQKAFDTYNSISAILRSLNLSETCHHSRKILKERTDICMKQHVINIKQKSPFDHSDKSSISDDEYFTIGIYRKSGHNLKRRMFKLGYKNECMVCHQPNTHNGLPLTIQLDHINGNPFDNRLENLRFICPNCHSQTPTFGGRNSKDIEQCGGPARN